jgi:glycogen debranching enzyme
MRSIFLSFITLCFVLSLYSQETVSNVLIIGKGEPWSEQEHQEILRYYAIAGFEFSWLDGEKASWKDIDLAKYDIIWLHRADSLHYADFEDDPAYYKALLDYAEGGGNILLTQHALEFLNKSGLEPVKVEHRSKQSEDNGYGRMLGFHAFRHHPIFDSLHGGAYIWKPPHDTTVTQCGFFDDNVPGNGKVIGVDWDYIFVRENSKLIVEYEVGEGKVLGIGAYFNLFEPNLNKSHYDVFYDNVFGWLAGKKEDSEAHYWLYGEHKIEPLDHVLKRQFLPMEAKQWEMEESPLALGRDHAQNEYCEVAGRRLLVAAYEPGGIFEVWAHPFMAFRDYKAGIIFENDTARFLGDVIPAIEVTPASILRTYKFDNGAVLKEVMVVSPDKPVGVIHYEYDGPKARLSIQYKSNMRLMWPYSGNVLKTLKYAYQPGLNAIEFNAPEADLLTIIGASKIPVSRYSGPTSMIEVDFPPGEVVTREYDPEADTLFEVCAGLLFDLQPDDNLDIVFVAGSEGRDTVISVYMKAVHDPEMIYKNSVKHYEDLQNNMLSITTPDENFNKGYAWAVAATDRFFVETPGLGTSLVAGYNGTDRGWDGGHAVNGRPGYAWYFGRDAVWSAFAILDYGDYEGVKDILNMFIKYQDLNGKIFHELSTSGFVHYDAADATPLFIILAGRYLEYSGDREYIRSIWPAIEKAMKYCESTDTDGDGLIENTNVGHGWVEGGHLFGSHTSLYLASCWIEAIWKYNNMFKAIFWPQSVKWSNWKGLNEMLNGNFYNDENLFFFQGIYMDGNYHPEQSILPSIPMYFMQLDEEKTAYMLKTFASHEYSSDWGVRMTSIYNPHYHPKGYHSGAVWPLYTGWVALAEYNYERHLQGFTHITGNLNNYSDFALGYTEEVLNGEKYVPSGVCPHQCWSETMVIQPIIEGMLGYKHSRYDNGLEFSPNIPFNWDYIKVKNIRRKGNRIDFEMQRYPEKTLINFTGDTYGFTAMFFPLFMPGTKIIKVLEDGEEIQYEAFDKKQGIELGVSLGYSTDPEITVFHTGGISLIPPIEKPAKGEQSRGIRIIDASWENNTYTIEVEGAPAMSYELEVINNFGTPKAVEGATFTEKGNRLLLEVSFPALNRIYTPKTIRISF